MINRILFLFSLLVFGTSSYAQLGFEFNDSIRVIRSGDTLMNPWAGGLNYIQISDFDFDLDGDLDLFLFDRSSNNVRVFTQETNGTPYYKYVHNAGDYFPPDLRYRAHLIDYDNDGKKDLFTWSLGGLRVFKNVSTIQNGLQWQLIKDPVNSTYAVNGFSNLSISSGDIPAFVDVDFDGDIDILTPDLGGARVEYHQNQSIELYGIPDSLVFIQKNECWGKFSESPTSSVYILNDPNSPCVGGNIANPEGKPGDNADNKMHSGATILAIDIDSSGVYDLIMGDDSYNNLTLLTNGGTAVNTDSPMISFDDAFPSYTTPVKCYIFPAAYSVDVNFDGVKDLIASPNSKATSFNERSVFFYENIGTNGLPVYSPITNEFLQSTMIDHGSGSIPAFVDYNEDGLTDLLVANFFRYKPILDKESTVAYYMNTGTNSNPVFTFVDDDIFNLSTQSYGLRTVPTFGDLDNDGDDDLLFGLEDGTLIYHENLSTGNGAIWGTAQPNYTDGVGNIISVGSNCFPQLFDLNNDGLLDLILGKNDGTLTYYENNGTSTSPSFNLVDSILGAVDIDTSMVSEWSAPHFFRNDGVTSLFVGSFDGHLHYYDQIDNAMNSGANFNLVSHDYLSLDVGAYSTFAVKDIDNDSLLNMMVGQDLGGLHHMEVDSLSDVGLIEMEDSFDFKLYPNPSNGKLYVHSDLEMSQIIVYSMNGFICTEDQVQGNQFEIDLRKFDAGLYIVEIRAVGMSAYKKLILK